MPEIKIFVDQSEKNANTVILSPANANILDISEGNLVEIFNPDNGKTTKANVEISEKILDFAGKFSKDILDKLDYSGVELVVRSISTEKEGIPISQKASTPASPPSNVPQTQPTPKPKAPTQPSIPPPPPTQTPPAPQPSPPPPSSTPSPPPTETPPAPQPSPPPPSSTPSPPPIQMPPAPQTSPPPQSSSSFQEIPQPPSHRPQPETSTPKPSASSIPPQPIQETYNNRIDINMLQQQKNGIILRPVVSPQIEGGRVKLNTSILNTLGLGQGMLIGWEDPLTRAQGSARVDAADISENEIRISQDTKEDTHIKSEQIVVYSTEPPIQKAESLMLEVESLSGLDGYCLISPRTLHSLSLQIGDVITFEDELTGAIGAGKVNTSEEIPDNAIVIDSEILEASGIGSFEVKVSKNQRQIIPLQSVSLGISPISGENMWELISTARQNVEELKEWLKNYIVFKGIKLRWKAVNIACSFLECVPDLTGDILAMVTDNTTITLSPVGLIPFNAILIIDISRSMMARDVLVTNIAPAIEGIKAAMESREIQEFLKKFKDGINIPRRISAAFAAVLFLSEKVGRGFGEKVSVIRFADEAQILPFQGGFYMDSASGKKGILEDAARMIVDRIGNAYGQATNMGDAMIKAKMVFDNFKEMNPDQPTMIVLLTDGVPTDGDAFLNTIQQFSEDPNVVIYILGLGNPDDDLMNRAAQLCGGEYFKPEDAGELLVWYSKRARDLSVKLKAHK